MLIVLSRAVVLICIILLMSNSYSHSYSHRISDKEINLIFQQMCSHIDPTIKGMDEELIGSNLIQDWMEPKRRAM